MKTNCTQHKECLQVIQRILDKEATAEETKATAAAKAKTAAPKAAAKKATKEVENKQEKTTLGDLDVLSNLKDAMDKAEKGK